MGGTLWSIRGRPRDISPRCDRLPSTVPFRACRGAGQPGGIPMGGTLWSIRGRPRDISPRCDRLPSTNPSWIFAVDTPPTTPEVPNLIEIGLCVPRVRISPRSRRRPGCGHVPGGGPVAAARLRRPGCGGPVAAARLRRPGYGGPVSAAARLRRRPGLGGPVAGSEPVAAARSRRPGRGLRAGRPRRRYAFSPDRIQPRNDHIAT